MVLWVDWFNDFELLDFEGVDLINFCLKWFLLFLDIWNILKEFEVVRFDFDLFCFNHGHHKFHPFR